MSLDYSSYNPVAAAKAAAYDLILAAMGAAIAAQALPAAATPAFRIEIPADIKNGDFACNAAMVSAKAFRLPPRKIAALAVTVAAASATMLPTTGSAAETAVLTALAAAASAEPVRMPVSDR